jgi:hypothetical protein
MEVGAMRPKQSHENIHTKMGEEGKPSLSQTI